MDGMNIESHVRRAGLTSRNVRRQTSTGLQEITIKIHLRNVYRKIGAVNRAQAVRIALSSGWPMTVPG